MLSLMLRQIICDWQSLGWHVFVENLAKISIRESQRHVGDASQHGPNLIALFTGNCQVETLFSSDIS